MQKILVVTPLYPPDIAPLAIYVKEVAQRMSTVADMTILAYGQLPEKISGVRIVSVSKNNMLPIRLFYFFWSLIKEARHADYIYAQNGASVELPMFFASFITRTPFVFHLGDIVALTTSKQRWTLRTLTRIVAQKATRVICSKSEDMSWLPHVQTVVRIDTLTVRPEIMPFVPYPTQEFAHYEQSWKLHTQELINIFNHAKK